MVTAINAKTRSITHNLSDHTMKFFFSCDWGTSTFRLRLVDAENEKVLSEIITGNGIASTYKSWKETGNNEKNKLAFYQSYLFEQIKNITSVINHSFHNTPIIISGMASSNIGMVALPYKSIPYYRNGYDLVIETIDEAEEIDQHKIVLISGVRSESDVMRGEETILAGCNVCSQAGEQLFILPGTHSKHIVAWYLHAQYFFGAGLGFFLRCTVKTTALSSEKPALVNITFPVPMINIRTIVYNIFHNHVIFYLHRGNIRL